MYELLEINWWTNLFETSEVAACEVLEGLQEILNILNFKTRNKQWNSLGQRLEEEVVFV